MAWEQISSLARSQLIHHELAVHGLPSRQLTGIPSRVRKARRKNHGTGQ